jgi:capsular polysaccharide transport system permease protein
MATSTTTLQQSLTIQLRVISALLMREVLTRYGRDNIGFLWLFVEPMIFTLGVTAMWITKGGYLISSLPIIPFAVTGYSSVLMWRNAASRCSKAIVPNLSLLYHRNVTVLDLFLARIILEVAGATTSLVTLSLILVATDWMDPPVDMLTMAGGWLMLAWFSAGLGLIVGALTELSDAFERIWHILTYLAFPVSGAFFMVEWLPQHIQEMALWVPMINAAEMMRDGYYGDAVKTHYSITYLVQVNFSMLLIGLMLVHKSKDLVGSE